MSSFFYGYLFSQVLGGMVAAKFGGASPLARAHRYAVEVSRMSVMTVVVAPPRIKVKPHYRIFEGKRVVLGAMLLAAVFTLMSPVAARTHIVALMGMRATIGFTQVG